MTKTLVRVGFGKPVARKFEQELNELTAQGWTQLEPGVEIARLGFFRYILLVTLSKDEE